MGTKAQTLLMTLVYVGLGISLTGLLSTALIENFPHQVFGIAFFALLICHLLLNRFWIRHSLIGKWDPRRIFLIAIDTVVGALSFIQCINCILLSSFFWNMLPQDIAYASSNLHLCIGTWIFVIAAIHFGLNINALIGNRLHIGRTGKGKLRRTPGTFLMLFVWLMLAAIGIYGFYEFFQLSMLNYMFFLGDPAVPVNAPGIVRFFRYLCVGIALTEITHCLSIFLQHHAQKKRARSRA